MRITGKDKACGTVSFSRVDKMDFLITKTCPEAGEEEEESMAYIAIAKLYPTHKLSYTRMCIHYTYLSPYLSLCVCTRYPPWNIFAASQRFVLWASFPKAFSLVLIFLGVLLC
jgi:hypothetical protein